MGLQHHADTLLLTRERAEQIFLEQNVALIAGKLDIREAEARIIQARLWPNPNFSIDQVNLWATPGQLSMGEELPPIFSNGWGRNLEITAQLEQVVITAGKRRKMIAVEEVSRDMAVSYFEDLIRNMKIEFRNLLTELQYLQQYQEVFIRQIAESETLVRAYERQVASGNVNRSEVIRLKALNLELKNEYNDLQRRGNEIRKELGLLMNLPSGIYFALSADGFTPDTASLELLRMPVLMETAAEKRPDRKLAHLRTEHANRQYSYERAQRTPDLTLKAGYDRGGNFLYNFVGFGIGLDLPLFHRNQGGIRMAEIGVQRAGLLEDLAERRIAAEVLEAYNNLRLSLKFYRDMDPGYEQELDGMLGAYVRNFRDRNVSTLEFLDFLEAYLENKKTMLQARKSLLENIEELKYAIGAEIE